MNRAVSSTREPRLAGYRLRVASRAVAAIGGGYVLAAAFAAAGALGFPYLGMARSDATMAATMFSFIVYALAAMWCFGCASARRAWLGCTAVALVLGALIWALLPAGQP